MTDARDLAAHRIALWREDPRRFAVEELGVTELDTFQDEFLQALGSTKELDRRIALKASKGPGKTFCLAVAGWWTLACQGDRGEHPNGFAISVSEDNLRSNLWKELAKWRDRSELLKAAFTQTKTRIFNNDHPETWWLDARTWSKSADQTAQSQTLAGLHSGYVFVLADESGSIPSAVMATAEAALSSCIWGKIFQAGNPTNLEGPLYDACGPHRKLWHVITINGDPDSPTRAKRVSVEWAKRQIEMYGRDNPWVLVNVFGEFPPSSINTLLGVDDVERAMTRYGAIKEDDYNYSQKRIGCDVARFGDDRNVFFPRQGVLTLPPVVTRNQRGPQMAARVSVMRERWGGRVSIFVDSGGGYGATLEDSLHAAHIPYVPVGGAEKAMDPRYENRRAEQWCTMAEWVKDRGSLPPSLGEIVPELTQVQYTFTSKGRLIIEPKADVKGRLGYSPDLADALALTFALPEMADIDTDMGRALAGVSGGGMVSEWDPLASAERDR